jgi:hypothetical protein
MHYYHLGDAIEYSLIFPAGTLKTQRRFCRVKFANTHSWRNLESVIG